MNDSGGLWRTLGLLFAISFGALLLIGGDIYRRAPPVPAAVTDPHGGVIHTRADIQRGRQVWQTTGGHQLGSIWSHGAYVAPHWTADWLHREAIALLDIWAGNMPAFHTAGRSYSSSAWLSGTWWVPACSAS